MISVGLTGNVASGKSAVAAIWEAAGVPIVSADELARRAVAPGTQGLTDVIDTFGAGVLGADGGLDRSHLRNIVFGDAAARARLEEIVHPIVWALRAEWLEERDREGVATAVSEIPLLFETGHEGDFDVVVLVDAPDALRLARIVENRGLSQDDARRMMDAQMDADAKRSRADHVIRNAGSLRDLEQEALRVLALIGGPAPRAAPRSSTPSSVAGATMRIDMHLHTAGSWDCLSDAEQVLERALALGYHRIAITDHNRTEVALRMAERHPDLIIPGEEVKTGEGIDVIGLYLSEEIPEGTPAEETIARIREQGGIPYLPHPYAGGKGGGGAYADVLGPLCDVIEVFNARLHSADQNDRARALAKRHTKLCGAGSDAHTVGEIGNAFVDLPEHANRPDALLAALASATTGGREASRLVHLASTWAKVRRKLPGSPTG